MSDLKQTYDEIALQLQESIQDSLLTSVGAYGSPLASGRLLASIDRDWETQKLYTPSSL